MLEHGRGIRRLRVYRLCSSIRLRHPEGGRGERQPHVPELATLLLQIQASKIKQKGGAVGTDGTVGVLFDDIFGIVNQTISTIGETVDLVDYVSNLDTNLGYSYSPTETNAPGANLS